jgi:hypothetical protein
MDPSTLRNLFGVSSSDGRKFTRRFRLYIRPHAVFDHGSAPCTPYNGHPLVADGDNFQNG